MTNQLNEISLYQVVYKLLNFKTGAIVTLQPENEFDVCVNKENISNSR